MEGFITNGLDIKRLAIVLLITAIPICSHSEDPEPTMFTNKVDESRTLIVISAPGSSDKYYQSVYDQIIQFDIDYAKSIMGKDNIIILGDKKALGLFKKDLPEDILLEAGMEDIWMRDYSTINPYNPVQFRYTAAAQSGSQRDADWVQKRFNTFTKKLGIKYDQTQLALDGGNVVDNYKDKAVVTERFLNDNKLTYNQAKKELIELLGVSSVAIIPSDDDEGLAHADGMLMFIDGNTIVLNKYDEPFRTKVISELRESFSSIKIIEIETSFDSEDWDDRFSSACGIYTNSIVTENYIYMPVFGTTSDEKVRQLIQKYTEKKVVPIDARKVCFMGGSVRCLGWQLSGENAVKLIEAARNQQ